MLLESSCGSPLGTGREFSRCLAGELGLLFLWRSLFPFSLPLPFLRLHWRSYVSLFDVRTSAARIGTVIWPRLDLTGHSDQKENEKKVSLTFSKIKPVTWHCYKHTRACKRTCRSSRLFLTVRYKRINVNMKRKCLCSKGAAARSKRQIRDFFLSSCSVELWNRLSKMQHFPKQSEMIVSQCVINVSAPPRYTALKIM